MLPVVIGLKGPSVKGGAFDLAAALGEAPPSSPGVRGVGVGGKGGRGRAARGPGLC